MSEERLTEREWVEKVGQSLAQAMLRDQESMRRSAIIADHQHRWKKSLETILTYIPELAIYECKCGAVTHDLKGGQICPVCSDA